MAAQVTPLSPTPATTNQLLVETTDSVAEVPQALLGWSLAESTGSAAAKVRIYDGTGTSGRLMAVIALVSGASSHVYMAQGGLELFNGALYLQVVSGSVEGSVYWS